MTSSLKGAMKERHIAISFLSGTFVFLCLTGIAALIPAPSWLPLGRIGEDPVRGLLVIMTLIVSLTGSVAVVICRHFPHTRPNRHEQIGLLWIPAMSIFLSGSLAWFFLYLLPESVARFVVVGLLLSAFCLIPFAMLIWLLRDPALSTERNQA